MQPAQEHSPSGQMVLVFSWLILGSRREEPQAAVTWR